MNEGLTGKGLYSDNCKVNDDLLIIYSQVHQETPRKRVISGNRLKLNGIIYFILYIIFCFLF